jgi:hypothetical protein
MMPPDSSKQYRNNTAIAGQCKRLINVIKDQNHSLSYISLRLMKSFDGHQIKTLSLSIYFFLLTIG